MKGPFESFIASSSLLLFSISSLGVWEGCVNLLMMRSSIERAEFTPLEVDMGGEKEGWVWGTGPHTSSPLRYFGKPRDGEGNSGGEEEKERKGEEDLTTPTPHSSVNPNDQLKPSSHTPSTPHNEKKMKKKRKRKRFRSGEELERTLLALPPSSAATFFSSFKPILPSSSSSPPLQPEHLTLLISTLLSAR